MKKIYLIRHSAPFVEINNYSDYKKVCWKDYNRNMILSSEGEVKAKKLCNLQELVNINAVYSADSYRAIGTAKYIAEMNNLKIKLDNRINERNLGVNMIGELPDNQILDSFNNKNYKFGSGESLNEVDERFNSFIAELLNGNERKIALFIHGIIMMSFLQNHTEFSFDGKNLRLVFNEKEIYNGKIINPMVFEITYDDNNKLSDVKYIE